MSTYTVFLIFPSIVGVGIQVLVFMQGDYNHWGVAFFAAYLAGWALTFTDNMTQVEDIMAMRWGTVKFNDAKNERDEYEGKETISPVDGRPAILGDVVKQKRAFKSSAAFVLFACFFSLLTVVAVYLFRYYLYHMDEDPNAGIDSQKVTTPKSYISKVALQLASAVNAVQTQLFNYFFTDIAIWLTDMENHQFQGNYDAALVAKVFVFLVSN